jgi:hypothetical protein
MIKKKRVPRAGDRVKVGRRLITVPGVPSMTDPSLVAPTAKPGDGESKKQADELAEELARAIKAAYQ